MLASEVRVGASEVRVGDGSMPWNAKSDARGLGPVIPKSDVWASAKQGIDQLGAVYTAQGFEFDDVGVIVGPDLVYRTIDGGWVGQRDQSHDRVVRRGVTQERFTDFVKSTYRVIQGPTRVYVRDRAEQISARDATKEGKSILDQLP